ncbi:hypothetical protein [Pseudomonas sp. RIT-PI-S]|uniref:hypothetical protein n=1 Tax=Pseudomonas sp. RIT-PI-S TaxID=3035295 RepID=UPI0021D82412|nr:hypothetical protein [Pseudomonas sp. RIT-PI-S]
MSSPRKQQKKNKRASAKARQNRILRNNVPDAPAPKNPDALAPDTISMEDFFEGGMEAQVFDEMFDAMKHAEEHGLQAVCEVFHEESPLPLVVDNYSAEDIENLIVSLWVAYYELQGMAEDDAVAKVSSDEFMQAYIAASEAVVARAAE